MKHGVVFPNPLRTITVELSALICANNVLLLAMHCQGPTSSCKCAKDRMKGDSIDRVDQIPASFAFPVAFEGILPGLDLLTVIKILHCYPALNRAERIAGAIGIAAYAACLVLER